MKKVLLALLILVIVALLLVRAERKSQVSPQPIGDAVVLPSDEAPPKAQPQPAKPLGKCYVGGCSSQICSDEPDAVSTCEFRPEYACYQGARCERQASGQCGWTQTPALRACLSNPQQ